jgi:hypothetical protein
MKNNIFKLITLFFIISCLFTSNAQTIHKTLVATGGNAFGLGGSAAFTIGQLVFSTNTNYTGSVSEGIQQPFEISIIDEVIELPEIELDILTYPNPVSGVLTLKVRDFPQKTKFLGYQLLDNNGKLLDHKRITDFETAINVQGYSSSIYFLKVIDLKSLDMATVKQKKKDNMHNSNVIKTFKIIKN